MRKTFIMLLLLVLTTTMAFGLMSTAIVASIMEEAVLQVQAIPQTMLINKAKALLVYRGKLTEEIARVDGLLYSLNSEVDVDPAIPEWTAPYEPPDYIDSWR